MEELMKTNDLDAAKMTHLLWELGNGNMLEGIRSVFEEGVSEGASAAFLVGRREGWLDGYNKGMLKGAGIMAGASVLVAVCVWGVRKHRAKKRPQTDKRKTNEPPLEQQSSILGNGEEGIDKEI